MHLWTMEIKMFLNTECTHRDSSFIEVGEAFLQLSV